MEECIYKLDQSFYDTKVELPVQMLGRNFTKKKRIILSDCFDPVSTQLPVFGLLIDLKTFQAFGVK